MFDAGSIIWPAHRITIFSSIRLCISYSIRAADQVEQLSKWHAHSTRFTKPRMSTRHQCEASTYVAPRSTLRNSRPRLLPRLPLPIPTSMKLSLLARAPACPRCCCRCCPAAVGIPYERRQIGWLQATVSAAVESWQTGFNSFIVQHVRLNRALTPLFDLQCEQQSIRRVERTVTPLFYRCQISRIAMSVPTILMVSRCQVSRFQSPQLDGFETDVSM